MQLSRRITGLTAGGSDGWDVYYRAKDMLAAGEPVIQLTIGEHDIGTDRKIIDAMHAAALEGHVGYSMFNGNLNLREAVAARVTARTGVPTTPDNVLVVPGGQAGLFAAHHAACEEGDTALYIDPYYATYPGTLRGAGAEPVAVRTRAEDAFQPRAKEIEAMASGAASLLVNTPNNPTGTVYSRETLDGIADVCKRHDLWLISDEVYDTQVWEGEHISPRSLPGMAERTLVIGSMSKSHAMTGSRIGWVCGPKDAIGHLINLATHTNYGVSGFVQDAVEFAIAQGEQLEEQVAEPFRRRRQLATEIVAAQNTVTLVPAQGAMYLMLDVRATGLNGEAFANKLLDAHKIAVMPGESFGQSAAGHVRVAMTIDDARFASALQTLCDFARTIAQDK